MINICVCVSINNGLTLLKGDINNLDDIIKFTMMV